MTAAAGIPAWSLRWTSLGALFTLTPGSSPGQALALSRRGRVDAAPGTALLGSRLRGNDVRG